MKLEDRIERFYRPFEDPAVIRSLFLQLKTEKEWTKPQPFGPLRKKKVQVGDRAITIHTLLHLYSIHKYNTQQPDVGSYITFHDAQDDPKYKGVIRSSREELGELLDFAGLKYKFTPTLGDCDIDLHDPALLKRLLSHCTYEGRDLTPREIKDFSANKFRRVRMYDPTTGFAITGQSLMIYYSALAYIREHPEVGLEVAANKLHKGKSNQAVMDDILEKARI